jgi:hypothetical protein
MTIKLNKLIGFSLTVWALVGIAILFTVSFVYLWRIVLLDHAGEVTLSAVSWLLYNGSPLYTTVDAPERYSLQHGPIIYLVVGGIMKLLGPSILTAKLSSVVSLLAISAISWCWFKRFFDSKISLWLLGLEVWLFLKYYYLYLVRDDVLMVLCTLIGIYFVTTKRGRVSTILGVGLSFGILVNLKVHGILYAIPALTLVQQKFGRNTLLLSMGSVACVFMLPFLLPNISLVNYVQWVTLSTEHGLSLKIFKGNLSMAILFCLLPLTLATYLECDLIKVFKGKKLFIGALGLTLLLVAIIGSKLGSGSHHLAPIIPMIMYVVVLVVQYSRTDKTCPSGSLRYSLVRRIGNVLGVLVFFTLLLNGANGQGRIIKYMQVNTVGQERIEELHYIQEKYQGISMAIGYGEERSYRFYDELIPILVFDGNPYLLDVSALNDMTVVGSPIPETTISSLAKGSTRIWLLPKGDIPFSLMDGYSGGTPLFSEPFRQMFFADYTIIEKTKHFDIWYYTGDKRPSFSAAKL